MINPYKNDATPRCKHILGGIYDRFETIKKAPEGALVAGQSPLPY